jgi:beta-lactamase regulating signal transducer with metallopeptidase domain
MIDHLLASTCTAVLAVALALIIPRHFAGLRYATLLVAVLRFALPTHWLVLLGKTLAGYFPHTALPVYHPSAFIARSLPLLSPPIHRGPDFLLIAACCVWAMICVLLLALHIRRLTRGITGVREPSSSELRVLAQAAADMNIARPVPLDIASSDCMPCALGLLRPRIVIPDGLSNILDQELRAVLAHELAHVRRHDNVVAALVRAIGSLFWFHPLLWWIERRMMSEREIACDRLVLAGGAKPREYADGIMKVCRMLFIGSPAFAGAAGPVLKQRLDQILSARPNRPSPRLMRALPAIVAAGAVTVPFTTAFLRAQPGAHVTRPGSKGLANSHHSQMQNADASNAIDAIALSKAIDQSMKNLDASITKSEDRAPARKEDLQVHDARLDSDESPQELDDLIARSARRALASIGEPGDPDARFREVADTVGYTYIKSQRNGEAIAIYRSLLESAPAHETPSASHLHLYLAIALHQKGDRDAARAELALASASQPSPTELEEISEAVAAW